MHLLRRLTLCAVPLLLSACASFQEPTVTPPENTHAVMRLDASGEQVFRCVHDMKGWFWRFEAPNAYLFNPVNGQAVAKHGYRFSFVHNDGSKSPLPASQALNRETAKISPMPSLLLLLLPTVVHS